MTLSKNSWHYWLYTTVYSTSVPTNLCPYFWKLVWGCIIFIPITIIFVPWLLLNWISDRKEFTYPNYYKDSPPALILTIATILGVNMIAMFWHWPTKLQWLKGSQSAWFVLGVIGWCIGIFILVVYIVTKAGEAIEERKLQRMIKGETTFKEKKPNIIKAFIRAKIEKSCPRIDWD